mgnify:CR=1 FL=1
MLIETEIKIKKFKDKTDKIRLVIFDVDGVFTDGSVYLDEKGKEMLRFSRVDGKGIELLRKNGIKTAVISSEYSEIVKKRMEKLMIDQVYFGIKDKVKVYEKLKNKYLLNDEVICFCGDDIQDLEVIKMAGFSCCPQNAQEEIKKACDYISERFGGNGFVRDVCNMMVEGNSKIKRSEM